MPETPVKRTRQRHRGKGEGSIRQRPNGTWEARYTAGWTPDGKQERRSVYGRTRAECAEKLKVALSQTPRNAAVLVDEGKLSLADFMKGHFERRSAELSAASIVRINLLTNMIAAHAVGSIQLRDLKASHIERLYSDLSRRYKPSTIRHARAYINQALSWAVRHEILRVHVGHIAQSPRLREEPRGRRLDDGELAAILTELRRSRLYAPIALIAALGLRHGEALGLQWKDVDLAARTLTVSGGMSDATGYPVPSERAKTAAAHRTLYLSDGVLRLLEDHRAAQVRGGLPVEPEDRVFLTEAGKYLRQCVIRVAWRAARQRAGVAHPYRIHDLRHTAASRLIESGADPRVAADILGHTDLTLTLRVYAHSQAEKRKEVLMRAAGGMDALLLGEQ